MATAASIDDEATAERAVETTVGVPEATAAEQSAGEGAGAGEEAALPVDSGRMRVARGKVVGNTVVVEGEPLPEGSHVTVWVDDAEGFELDEKSLDELVEADAACERGESLTVTAEQLFERLARLRRR